MGDYAFDADSRVEPLGDGEFAAALTARWDGTGGVANGGYMLAACTRALAQAMPFPDPLAVSGFFLRPGTPGPAVIRTSLLRRGTSMAFGEASLSRNGNQVLRATAAFTNLDARDGPVSLGSSPPSLPPPQDCVRLSLGALGMPKIAEQIEIRYAELPGWTGGVPSGHSAAEFWMRFADGRDADLLALPLLADAAPPPILELGATSTTVQLTVHLRARPAPGWLACRAVTRYVSGGYHEEDFEIWDSAGTLAAQSRQLALILS
jgi:acyl-coenzyme A thioesterase PaaI-like protein